MNRISFHPARRGRRVILALAVFSVLAYLLAATALWGYYRFQRHVSGVHWIDIAVCTRFARVQQAVGAQHLATAKALWQNGEYAKGLFLARAALGKTPRDPAARLFLADCWQQAGRPDFAGHTLEDGLPYDPAPQPLARALIAHYLGAGQYRELLVLLRTKLPALGRQPEAGELVYYQQAEVQAVFETEGAEAADALSGSYAELGRLPAAAPLLARIDLARHQPAAALARLRDALSREPGAPALHDALIDVALETGQTEEARAAAEHFVAAFPSLPTAELRLLEVHSSRTLADRGPWLQSCMRYLARFRQQPGALEQLAELAARRGWSDLAFLLYQNSVATGTRDRVFTAYYIGSLLTHRDFAHADTVWRDLTSQKSTPADSAPALAAMVASGVGREGEALEHLERLRRDTAGDIPRRDRLARLFRTFGFAPLAEKLLAPGPATAGS
jgi:hypothetical protein